MKFFSLLRSETVNILAILLLLGLVSACAAEESFGSEKMAIKICPEESIEEAKAALDLQETDQNLSVEELLNRISEKGFEVEKKRYGVSRYKCPDSEIAPNTEVNFVYAGFDDTNQYTREFVIITGPNEIVEKIEVRRSYIAPGQ